MKSIITFRSEGHHHATGHLSRIQTVQINLLLDEAFPHIPQEPTEFSNLVFLHNILVAREANLILSREGYRMNRH